MSQYKLTIHLKQHTPIIHFQHGQEGATLRATELKPKLDEFLILKRRSHSNLDIQEKGALNYKVKILHLGSLSELPKDRRGNFKLPMYFGNTGKRKNDEAYKEPLFYQSADDNDIKLEFFSFKQGIINLIKDHIAEFFATTNFGMRQSKGYGSFYLSKSDSLFMDPSRFQAKYICSFNIKSNNWLQVFSKVELFYKFLRSGINDARTHHYNHKQSEFFRKKTIRSAYCKPVIFSYAMNRMKRQWDKKSIKETVFVNDYYKREARRNDINAIERFFNPAKTPEVIYEPGFKNQLSSFSDSKGPLGYSENFTEEPKLLLRDLFGISSEQDWGAYSAKLAKVHVPKDENSIEIERMKSPLLFKILKDENLGIYNIFIIANEVDSRVLGEKMEISFTSKKDPEGNYLNDLDRKLELAFPEKFEWKDFFEFLKTGYDLENEFLYKGRDGNQKIYQAIKSIVDQIQEKN